MDTCRIFQFINRSWCPFFRFILPYLRLDISLPYVLWSDFVYTIYDISFPVFSKRKQKIPWAMPWGNQEFQVVFYNRNCRVQKIQRTFPDRLHPIVQEAYLLFPSSRFLQMDFLQFSMFLHYQEYRQYE